MSLINVYGAFQNPSSWLPLIFYVYFLGSLPVNLFLAVPPDLWLTLCNTVYKKQQVLGLEVCARDEPYHNKKKVSCKKLGVVVHSYIFMHYNVSLVIVDNILNDSLFVLLFIINIS